MSFKDLIWDVCDDVYRKDKAISYSKLSTFAREGVETLISQPTKTSDELTFGSVMDCMLTEPLEFSNRYVVIDDKIFPSDTVKHIIDDAYKYIKDTNRDMINDGLGYSLSINDYYNNLTLEKRINKVLDAGSEYLHILSKNRDNMIFIEQSTFDQARRCAEAIKNDPVIYSWLDGKEVFYQVNLKVDYLPFKEMSSNMPSIKCKLDLVAIDHENKIIYPFDIKTTMEKEYQFTKSFFKWRYDIQQGMYTYILKEVIKNSKDFSKYHVADFRFIVVNRFRAKPLVHNIKVSKDFYVDHNMKSYKDLLKEAIWHFDNGEFNYPYKYTESKELTTNY